MLGDDSSTASLHSFLANRRYAISGPGMGNDCELHDEIEEGLAALVRDRANRHGRKLLIVGWSLGGLYTRRLEKLFPAAVRSVISLGRQFKDLPKVTNAWRIYEFVRTHKVEKGRKRMRGHLEKAPPVQTIFIFSRIDWVCAWQACIERNELHTENIEVQSSHCGFGHHPTAAYAIAGRLAQPEGQWTKFERKGSHSRVYPDQIRPSEARLKPSCVRFAARGPVSIYVDGRKKARRKSKLASISELKADFS